MSRPQPEGRSEGTRLDVGCAPGHAWNRRRGTDSVELKSLFSGLLEFQQRVELAALGRRHRQHPLRHNIESFDG